MQLERDVTSYMYAFKTSDAHRLMKNEEKNVYHYLFLYEYQKVFFLKKEVNEKNDKKSSRKILQHQKKKLGYKNIMAPQLNREISKESQ